jgi:hypothetical protein
LAALLESPLCLEDGKSIVMQKQRPLEQQDKTAKGGGDDELKNVSKKK